MHIVTFIATCTDVHILHNNLSESNISYMQHFIQTNCAELNICIYIYKYSKSVYYPLAMSCPQSWPSKPSWVRQKPYAAIRCAPSKVPQNLLFRDWQHLKSEKLARPGTTAMAIKMCSRQLRKVKHVNCKVLKEKHILMST